MIISERAGCHVFVCDEYHFILDYTIEMKASVTVKLRLHDRTLYPACYIKLLFVSYSLQGYTVQLDIYFSENTCISLSHANMLTQPYLG